MFCRIKLVVLTLALSACSEPPSHVIVTGSRTTSVAPKPALSGATTEQRFGRSRSVAPSGGQSESPIVWDAPSDWVQVAPSQYRNVNYRVGAETECYISLLPGEAGGLLANVNRWRTQQMGLQPATEAELKASPKIELLGESAPLIVLEGSYSGMSSEARSDWMMYGTLLVRSGGTLFVKMVGPGSEVRSQRDNFMRFCASIEARGAANVGKSKPQVQSKFAWTAPESWVKQGPRDMREVSYSFGAADEGVCYVSVFGGGVGGITANVNRWRKQVGLGDMSAKEIGELPQLDVLGGKATMFEASGAFTGMGDGEAEADQTLLGIIRELEGQVLFVKMIGPATLVAEERERFVAFCTSLREES